VTLLEPVAKKRAFLKEAARVCGLRGVEVRRERLEDFARGATCLGYDAATARAVGRLEALIPQAARCLREGGELFLWLSRAQINTLDSSEGEVARVRILAAPGGGQGGIWWGRKAEGST